MPPRLGHRKSRLGCIQCKKRRVKCNEQAPCQNCHRRGEKCSLLDDNVSPTMSNRITAHSPASSGNSRGESLQASNSLGFFMPTPDGFDFNSSTAYPSQTSRAWSDDLYLMHHFSMYTASTLTTIRDIHTLWHDFVPSLAREHPFLQHGILMMAASHLREIHPDQDRKYALLASQHQAAAISLFRHAMLNITPDNCVAVFIMAALWAINCMVTLCYPVGGAAAAAASRQDSISLHTYDDVIQLFILTRGVRDTILPSWHWISQAPVRDFLKGNGMGDYERVTLPPVLATHVAALNDTMVPALASSPDAVRYCTMALHELENIFKDIVQWDAPSQDRNDIGVLLKWSVTAPGEFIALLRRRDPAALVLLGHYICLFKLLDLWYTKGWWEQAWRSLVEVVPLGSPAEEWLKWPEAQMNEGMPAFAKTKLAEGTGETLMAATAPQVSNASAPI